eukprot:UN06050
MKQTIPFLLWLSCVFGAEFYQYDMIPKDSNETDNSLGICFGSSTQWASYPYTVALRYTSGSACCSGSILSLNPGVILTAAHCNGCTGAVRVGCNNPNNCDGDSYQIAQFIQNPSYGSPLQFSNDLGLIRTSIPITTSGATAIQITPVQPSIGQVRVVGYGITQTGSIPTQLQTMESNHIEQQECQDIMSAALGGGEYIDETMLCIRAGNAGQDNVPTMCSGDSGGPMTAGIYQYG